MKKIQSFYLYSYRLVGFIFLTGLIISILWYGFTLLFFIGSSSWAVPIILSPGQEKVMDHLEHIVVLEHNASKDMALLKSLEQNLKYKKNTLKKVKQLQNRIQHAITAQANQYQKNSLIFKALSHEKKITVSELMVLASQTQPMETSIDQELEVGLITKKEALAAHLASNKIHSELVDAKARMQDLHQRALDFYHAAKTLNGADDNMVAMSKIMKKVELESQITLIKSDIFSLNVTIHQLKQNIQKKTKALSLMKKSPYIQAIKASTTVAFVPYYNLKRVKIGSPVYSCYLDMIFCYQSGQVLDIYNAEEYFAHPIFKSEVKGQLVGIQFNHQQDGQKKLLFLNAKPLIV